MPAPLTGPIRLFVYGTLMSEGRLAALTGRTFVRQSATLHDFARIAPPDGYPYVVPRAGASVEGTLVHDVDPESLAALDAYEEEGRLYARLPATVVVDGRAVACEVYVGRDVVR